MFAAGLLALTLNFASCDDNDTIEVEIPENVAQKVYGDYAGTMLTEAVVTPENEGEPEGTAVEAVVKNDTVYFESIPIRDIVLGIIPDEETADKIVEAVGDVAYKIGYTAKQGDSANQVLMAMDPKPLVIDIAIPQEGAEPANLHVEVSVAPVEGACYDTESSELKFKITATEVNLGEGENQTPIEDFPQTTFDFSLVKKTAE